MEVKLDLKLITSEMDELKKQKANNKTKTYTKK